jgi:probable rRNA maturation factor
MLPTPRFLVSPSLERRVGPALLARLAVRVRRAATRLRVAPEAFAGLGLRVVDDAEMARLHLEFMGEPGPTDVLSFGPGEAMADGLGAGDGDGRFEDGGLGDGGLGDGGLGDGGLGAGGLGDIVLDWDAVQRQARDGSPAALLDEATVLIVHGLAHLHGHDHRNRREGRAMHALERRVLRALRVPDPPRPYAPRLRTTRPAAPAGQVEPEFEPEFELEPELEPEAGEAETEAGEGEHG